MKKITIYSLALIGMTILVWTGTAYAVVEGGEPQSVESLDLVLPVQATDVDDLEVCPNEDVTISPFTPQVTPQELKVSYTCKVIAVETKNYKTTGNVQWTLVKQDGDKQIWAAHTLRWGMIYVGYIEAGLYSFLRW